MATDPDLGRCVWALGAARHRWQTAVGETLNEPELPERQAAATGEALMWAFALDDACDERIPTYTTDRATNALLLDGLRHARNHVVHRLVHAIDTEAHEGMSYPMAYPMTFVHWVWRAASEIPIPPTGRGRGPMSRQYFAAYAQRWEGREVGQTLAELYDWFTNMIR